MAAARPSTNNTAQTAVQLCEFCQTKPRFGNHKHCGKTCSNAAKAAKAATTNNNLCKNCQQKPKFGTFDYCGKNCAAQAASTGASKGSTGNSTSKSSSKKKGSTTSQPATNNAGPALAQTLANALLPQVQAAAAAALSSNPNLKPIATALQTSGAATAALNVLQSQYPGLNLSSLAGMVTGGQAAPGQAKAPPRLATNPFVTVPSTGPVPKCRIPKCEQLVFVDSEGVYGEYCSQLCREEAVDTDLVSPCIMCMCLPQGKADHFCSRACREDALSKPLPRPKKN